VDSELGYHPKLRRFKRSQYFERNSGSSEKFVIPNCAASKEASPLTGIRDLLSSYVKMLKQVQHDTQK